MCNKPHNPISRRRLLQIGAGVALLPAMPALASETASQTPEVAPVIDLPKPGMRDACPVCGMFPAKYPDWIATVLFKDGHADHFDGAKDFFKYLFDMEKFASGRKREQITGMGVTSYYSTEMIDATKAIYVIGSAVLGPMGHDLIPHPDMYDAEAFMLDHIGHGMVRFEETSMEMMLALDEGKFIL